MAVNAAPNPSGIDALIYNLGNYLYERTYTKWGESGLTANVYQVYGRVFRNWKEDGFVPQWYRGTVEYMADMFHDDRISVLIWFGMNDPTQIDGEKATYDISMYLFGNLNDIKPGNPNQRMDEVVRRDILQLLQPEMWGFRVTKVWNDIDKVLDKYSGFAKKGAYVNQNHQPKVAMRFDMTLVTSLDEDNGCDDIPAIPQPFSMRTGAIRVIFKDNPDPLAMQTLVNGVRIPKEYPTGPSLTIPHLEGRYVLPNVILNGNNIQDMPYNEATTTFTFGDAESRFFDGDRMLIYYNENS